MFTAQFYGSDKTQGIIGEVCNLKRFWFLLHYSTIVQYYIREKMDNLGSLEESYSTEFWEEICRTEQTEDLPSTSTSERSKLVNDLQAVADRAGILKAQAELLSVDYDSANPQNRAMQKQVIKLLTKGLEFLEYSLVRDKTPTKTSERRRCKSDDSVVRRQRFSDEQQNILLTAWKDCHYPSEEQCVQMAQKISCDPGKIRKWFSNKRSRSENPVLQGQ